jgi:hypothetical protein
VGRHSSLDIPDQDLFSFPFTPDEIRQMARDAEAGALPVDPRDIERLLLTVQSFGVGLSRVASSRGNPNIPVTRGN